MNRITQFIISFFLITVVSFSIVIVYDATVTKELYDENGLYIEGAFIHNMAMKKANGLTLFSYGHSDYTVVYSSSATEREMLAVEDFLVAFEKMSGVKFTAKPDSVAETKYEICIGKTNRDFESAAALETDAAYIIKTNGTKLFLYGKSQYGVSNAVYGFLEDYMGCMYLDADSVYYPRMAKAIIPQINDHQEPAFEVRDLHAYQTNRSADLRRQYRLTGEEVFNSDGCHKSIDYVPIETYFDEHPEYYALLEGERRSSDYMFQGPQLCWSNPEVIELLKEGVLKRIQEYEAAGGTQETYWDISQEDSMNHCECEPCKALNAQAGSDIGAILSAVNQIARELPEYKFSTLAYHYGSTPPTGIVPEDNVLIKYCFMSSFGANDLSKPIREATEGISKTQCEEITGWSRLTDNIYVWDYITNYFNYQLPFPCFQSLQGNYQLMAECNIRGVFPLNAYNERGAGDAMKNYLVAKLLWNPYCDYDALMNKYFTIYYGKAAAYIKEIYEMQEKLLDGALWVYDFSGSHKRDYLSENAVMKYLSLIQQAEIAARGNDIILKRIRYEKISVLYSIASLSYDYENLAAHKAELVTLCDEFVIESLNEIGSIKVDDYR